MAERLGYLMHFSHLLGWKLRTVRPVAGPLFAGLGWISSTG